MAFGAKCRRSGLLGIPMAAHSGRRTRADGFLVLVACSRDGAVRQQETQRFTGGGQIDLSP